MQVLALAGPPGTAPAYLGRHAQARQAAQRRLRALRLYAGPTDGTLNPAYLKALKAYQTAHDLASTGRLNRATLLSLGL